MTVEDHKRLRELAEKAGGDEWTPTYATRTDPARVWLPDGDGIAQCFGNAGHMPEPIDADDIAEFVAAANPATVIALLDEIERQQRQLAFVRGQNRRFIKLDESRIQEIRALRAEMAELRKSRADALLDAERAREERNRVGVEIRRELLMAHGLEEVGVVVADDPVHGWHMHATKPWDEIGAGTELYAKVK
ncbi:Ead/Ea22-like protein [Paraburkholderia sp. BL8N3]|nr:ead/Ea22-like family protein [Paraburkholderia sp. BL8N3]TCK39691.1 Ead/Ea22-like protein [Paraburkholderia sp. BL8N3]